MVQLFERFGCLADGVEHALVRLGKLHVSACHHAACGLEELGHGHVGVACSGAFAERRYEIAREARAVDIHTHAKHRGGVEHGVDACFGMVAHYQAAELKPCAQKMRAGIVPQPDRSIVVFQIGRYASGTDIAPLPDYGVAEETVVGLVGKRVYNHVVQFSAYFTPGADSCAGIYLGAHVHNGMGAYSYRSAQHTALHHLSVGSHVYRTGGGVEEGAFYPCAFLKKHERGVAYHSIRVAERQRGAVAGDGPEIGYYCSAVVQKNVVELLHGGQFARVW